MTTDLIQIVAKNVKAERLRTGLSQQRLAEKTGLSVRYISRLETEPQNLRIDKVALLANAMGLPPARLLQSVDCTDVTPSVAAALGEAIRLLQSIHTQCAGNEASTSRIRE